jgi:hypothetical protein
MVGGGGGGVAAAAAPAAGEGGERRGRKGGGGGGHDGDPQRVVVGHRSSLGLLMQDNGSCRNRFNVLFSVLNLLLLFSSHRTRR